MKSRVSGKGKPATALSARDQIHPQRVIVSYTINQHGLGVVANTTPGPAGVSGTDTGGNARAGDGGGVPRG